MTRQRARGYADLREIMPALHHKQWSPVSLCSGMMEAADVSFSNEKMQVHFMHLAVAGARMPHILTVFVLNAVQAAAKFGAFLWASFYGQHP